MSLEKWPRQYASDILLNHYTAKERREALKKVPEHLLEIVKHHLETWKRVAGSDAKARQLLHAEVERQKNYGAPRHAARRTW